MIDNALLAAYLVAYKQAADNPYNTYESLLKYHSTYPDEGLPPEESADSHLNYEIMNAVLRRVSNGARFKGLPNKSFSIGAQVPKPGYRTPLKDRLDSYVNHFVDSYKEPIEGIGSNREMNFGAEGNPTYIHDFDTGAFMLHPSVDKPGLDEKQRLKLLNKLRDKSVFRIGLMED